MNEFDFMVENVNNTKQSNRHWMQRWSMKCNDAISWRELRVDKSATNSNTKYQVATLCFRLCLFNGFVCFKCWLHEDNQNENRWSRSRWERVWVIVSSMWLLSMKWLMTIRCVWESVGVLRCIECVNEYAGMCVYVIVSMWIASVWKCKRVLLFVSDLRVKPRMHSKSEWVCVCVC